MDRVCIHLAVLHGHPLSQSSQKEWKCIFFAKQEFFGNCKTYWHGRNTVWALGVLLMHELLWRAEHPSGIFHEGEGCLGHKRTNLAAAIQVSTAGVSSFSPLPPFPYPAPSLTWTQWKQVHWGRALAQKIWFFPFSIMVSVTHLLLWCISTGGLWTQCIKQIIWAVNNVVCIPAHNRASANT